MAIPLDRAFTATPNRRLDRSGTERLKAAANFYEDAATRAFAARDDAAAKARRDYADKIRELIGQAPEVLVVSRVTTPNTRSAE